MLSKPKIIWIDGVSCYGCSHSFYNYPEIKTLLQKIKLLYHPLFPTNEFKIQKCDLLVIEGAIKENFLRMDFDLIDLITQMIKLSKKVLLIGTCAVYGGIFGEGVLFNKNKKGIFFPFKDKIIAVPGCPPHPEWIAYAIEMLIENKKMLLDNEFRPKEIFSYTSHMGCIRNEYFEWKIDAKNFGEKEGCLFYEQGCQGPFTHSSCNKILWNEVNSKPRAGTPCFGCTERNFPKKNLFMTEKFMGIPAEIPIGVSKRAYLTISGVAKSLRNERLERKLIDEDN